jgi:hypothetical protein
MTGGNREEVQPAIYWSPSCIRVFIANPILATAEMAPKGLIFWPEVSQVIVVFTVASAVVRPTHSARQKYFNNLG